MFGSNVRDPKLRGVIPRSVNQVGLNSLCRALLICLLDLRSRECPIGVSSYQNVLWRSIKVYFSYAILSLRHQFCTLSLLLSACPCVFAFFCLFLSFFLLLVCLFCACTTERVRDLLNPKMSELLKIAKPTVVWLLKT